jgi:predicted CoA-binding protein
VTPVAAQVLGERAWPTLAAVPEPVEVVEVFRARPGPHVEEAIAAGVSAVWLPLGVVDESAAALVRAAGLDVVMDRCPVIESSRLGLGAPAGGPAVEH